MVVRSQVEGRSVSKIDLPVERAADFCSPAALSHGVIPGEISGPFPNYEIPRAWAAAMDDAGFGGIRYQSRFTAGTGGEWCLAAFGCAGAGEVHVQETISARAAVREMTELTMVEIPRDTELRIVPLDGDSAGP